MTDRELLELAARAAGLAGNYYNGDRTMAAHFATLDNEGRIIKWNPLSSDGDALRLAVMLRMNVSSWGSGASAIVSAGDDVLLAEPHYGDDPCRATRRAITRAAAEIGRNMP